MNDGSNSQGSKKLHSKTIIYDNNFTNQHYDTTTTCRQKNSMTSIDSSFYSSSQSAEFKSKSCERLNTHINHIFKANENCFQINSKSTYNSNAVNQNAIELKPNLILGFRPNNIQANKNPNQLDKNNFDCLNSNKKLSYSKSLKLVPQNSNVKSVNNIPKSIWKPSPLLSTAVSETYQRVMNDRPNLIPIKPIPNVVNNSRKLNEVVNEPSWKELAHRKHTAW